MCESNKEFDFCPKHEDEYHIRKTTSVLKTCACGENVKECNCKKKQDVLEPVKIIRKSRTTHQEQEVTSPPRFRQMSTTNCNGNCVKTQMVIDIYDGLTAYPRPSPSPTPPPSSHPPYFHSPDPHISPQYSAASTSGYSNQNHIFTTPSSPPNQQDGFSNRLRNYYNQNAYQKQLAQMNQPDSTQPEGLDQQPRQPYQNIPRGEPCDSCQKSPSFQQPPSGSAPYSNWQQHQESNGIPFHNYTQHYSQSNIPTYDYRNPPVSNLPVQGNGERRTLNGKYGDTEYDIVITQYKERGGPDQYDQRALQRNQGNPQTQAQNGNIYNPYVQRERPQSQPGYDGSNSKVYENNQPCPNRKNGLYDYRTLNQQIYEMPSSLSHQTIEYNQNQQPNINNNLQHYATQGERPFSNQNSKFYNQPPSLPRELPCPSCQQNHQNGLTPPYSDTQGPCPDGNQNIYNLNSALESSLDYNNYNRQSMNSGRGMLDNDPRFNNRYDHESQPVTPSPYIKCQLTSTQQQYCPRNDQPIIQPQPCALVDGDGISNAKYMGICSWMLDPLAEDPETKCNYLQCQPAPNNLFCGRWQKMPCAPATAFDVTAQVCVWNAMSIPGPLPPPGTTTTPAPQFSPIKISIPLPNMNSQCTCKGGVQIGSCNSQYQCPGQSICQIGQSSSNTPCTVCCYYKSMME
ncbi:unnamed protein product [Bursaphelenchus xylophilus]|uniref:(pine wood nematode) hypothetical protein n=1 Tax=Bursaphelenchus xylophilus TaxID=6326 RepID=A0A1I7S316_BURXY|nr:unnamed protein product [Bursaphelenchus xylophilus]CAG9116063.1 unnamed protein product [Bursaphelenchus xylophilus]